jgi:hypothetical protein
VEMALRLAQNVHAPFYALAIVGTLANIVDIWWTSKRRVPSSPRVEVMA